MKQWIDYGLSINGNYFKVFNDYKEKEIADLMELPLNTVKSHLRRAKEELNVLLKGGCFNE